MTCCLGYQYFTWSTFAFGFYFYKRELIINFASITFNHGTLKTSVKQRVILDKNSTFSVSRIIVYIFLMKTAWNSKTLALLNCFWPMMAGARFEKKMSKVLLAFQQLCVNCFVTTLKIYCSQPAAPMRRAFQTRGKFWQVHAFLQFQGKKGGPSSFQIPTLTFVSMTSDLEFEWAELIFCSFYK